MLKNIYFFCFILMFLASCKSEEDTVIVTPPVVNTDPVQYGTPFTQVPNTTDIVMYEVNMRAFSNTDNFAGVTSRLDNLKDLGVNVVWLMPIYPVGILKSAGQMGSPYCVRNYKEVNTEFGTLEDLRALINAAHSKGMAVILDWVGNHTSWDNPWIDNKSWYTQDASGNIIIPAGTTWTDVADLNYNNQEMRQAMITAMKYWVLTANIDGFRCDYADGVPADFWKQATDTLKKIPQHQLIMLAEGTRKDHFSSGFQMNYSFDYYGTIKNVYQNNLAASNLFTTNSSEYSGIVNGGQKLRYTTNHDVCSSDGSPITIYGGIQGALSAFVITAYMGGVPLIYNGQEVGCPTSISFFSKTPIDWTINPTLPAIYKQILAVRQASTAVKTGTLEAYSNTNIVAFKRKSGTEEVLVIVNTRKSTINYTLDAAIANTNWKDALNNNAAVSLGTSLQLAPNAYMILKN